jgi:hypothetical protein
MGGKNNPAIDSKQTTAQIDSTSYLTIPIIHNNIPDIKYLLSGSVYLIQKLNFISASSNV